MSTSKKQEFPITDSSLNETQYNNVPKSSRVFISYSHDSNKHKENVFRLSERLCKEGIDCNIDQYETSPPEGWFQWMINQIEEADFILIVCTENYEKRFKGKDEVGKGRGVKWEGSIITQELYYSEANNKCIPIVFSPEDSEYIPSILKSATYYVLNIEEINDETYDELYARLTDQKLVIKSEIGELRPITPKYCSSSASVQKNERAIAESHQKPMIGELRKITVEHQLPDPFYDHFTRAIDRLGSKKMEIRLGAISALEIIANKSSGEYYQRIMELLTAYIREKSYIGIKNKKAETTNDPNIIPEDIQAVLTVIRRCKPSFYTEEVTYLARKADHPTEKYESLVMEMNYFAKESDYLDEAFTYLDLHETYLWKAYLYNAYLKGANLKGVNLSEANLDEANLQKSSSEGANLKKARLYNANLEGAFFIGAHFEEAALVGANLKYSFFTGAHFERATLQDADLESTFLLSAHLEEANLSGANLKGASLSEANLQRTFLRRANLERTNLKEADLEEADLNNTNFEGAYLEGANLKGAKNLTIDQLSKVKTLFNAKLDKEIETQLREKYPTLFEKPENESRFK